MVTKTQEKYEKDCMFPEQLKEGRCPCEHDCIYILKALKEQEEELRKGFADWDNDIICMDCGFVTHSSRDMVEHMSNYGGERSSSENCDIVKIENLNSPQNHNVALNSGKDIAINGMGKRNGNGLETTHVVTNSRLETTAPKQTEDNPNPSRPKVDVATHKKGEGVCAHCGHKHTFDMCDDWVFIGEVEQLCPCNKFYEVKS